MKSKFQLSTRYKSTSYWYYLYVTWEKKIKLLSQYDITSWLVCKWLPKARYMYLLWKFINKIRVVPQHLCKKGQGEQLPPSTWNFKNQGILPDLICPSWHLKLWPFKVFTVICPRWIQTIIQALFSICYLIYFFECLKFPVFGKTTEHDSIISFTRNWNFWDFKIKWKCSPESKKSQWSPFKLT